jgi:hypothetical protein
MEKIRNYVDYRSLHSIVEKPFNKKEIEKRLTKDNVLSEKVTININDLIGYSKDWIDSYVSKKLTGDELALDNVQYKVAGRTTKNEVILKVTASYNVQS